MPENLSLIKEEVSCLKCFELSSNREIDFAAIQQALKQDCVIKISNVELEDAEQVMHGVCNRFGLLERLELQASFASIHDHRKAMGQYYMTVNNRNDYHYIPSHSEGSSKAGMQIASVYCRENTTDGGYNLLARVKQDEKLWAQQGEYCIKVKLGRRTLAQREVEYIKSAFKLDLREDVLSPEDRIIEEIDLQAMGIGMAAALDLKAYRVISKVKKTRSIILEKDLYVYWDTVASFDLSSGEGYYQLLESKGLLRKPDASATIADLDNAAKRRVWSSGVSIFDLFECILTVNSSANELYLFNNLTWSHSSTNWTPQSGNREVYVAFA